MASSEKTVTLINDKWTAIIVELERAANRNSGLRALVYRSMIEEIKSQLERENAS